MKKVWSNYRADFEPIQTVKESSWGESVLREREKNI
jgi:hypothetical protein